MTRYAFWISLSFVAYTYLVYPLVISLIALFRGSPRPRTPEGKLPSITIIIVAFNEERYILEKLENCMALDYPAELLTICVVSDGSTDGTAGILRGRSGILFMEDDENRGKPSQINRAVEATESEIIVFSDVRQLYEPDALRRLAADFDDQEVGSVSGELLFRPPSGQTARSISLYWRYEKLLRKAESRIDSTLGATGAIYAVRRELFEPIRGDTILDDVEIPLKAFRKGYRVKFEPAAVAYDAASSEIGAEFRRKVRTLAGNFQLFGRNPWLLNPFKNRIFFQAVSHKLFRLFIPYAMAVLLVSTGGMKGAAFTALFWLQVAFYAAGAAALAAAGLRRNRLANFIAVFLSLNAASVAALFRYPSKKYDARWKDRK